MLTLSINIGQSYFTLMQIVKQIYAGSLLQNHLILSELLLLQKIQQFRYRWTSQKNILQMIFNLQIRISQQFVPQHLRQS